MLYSIYFQSCRSPSQPVEESSYSPTLLSLTCYVQKLPFHFLKSSVVCVYILSLFSYRCVLFALPISLPHSQVPATEERQLLSKSSNTIILQFTAVQSVCILFVGGGGISRLAAWYSWYSSSCFYHIRLPQLPNKLGRFLLLHSL